MSWRPPHYDPDVSVRDLASDGEWRVGMEQICARHGIPSEGLHPCTTGSDAVWTTGQSVVKLSAPMWRREIETEVACLDRVNGRLSVRTPRVLGRGELAGWPYLVMTHVPGVALTSVWPELDPPARARVAADLGRLARELHDLLELNRRRFAEPDGDAWARFWASCRTGVAQRHARGSVPASLLDQIDPFLDTVGELDTSRHVFLHTELLDHHVLVDDSEGQVELSSLIDFADARVGPPEYEFAAPAEFIFRGEPGLLRTFLLAYGEDPATLTAVRSKRMLAWALSHRFGSLERMLSAVAPAEPETLSALAQQLYGLEPASI